MQVQVSLTVEISARASVTQMERQIQEAGRQAMMAALQQALRQQEEHDGHCPNCTSQHRRVEGTVRRVIATTFGRVNLHLRRFRCQDGLRRWCPAKAVLAELAGASISVPLQEAAVLAGCSWPYRVACKLLKKLSGAQISPEEIRLQTNRVGKQRAKHQQQKAEHVLAKQEEEHLEPDQQVQESPACAKSEAKAQSKQENSASVESSAQAQSQEAMLVGIDGGWVCSCEQRGGMEGKVAVLCSHVEDLPMQEDSEMFSWSKRGRRRPRKRRHRLAERRYVATFDSSHQLGELAETAAQELCQGVQRPVVVLADGASWIKTQQRQHFAGATCILDWAHLWREVSRAIRAAARAKSLSQKASQYQLSLHKSWLWHGQVDQAIGGLRALGADLAAEPRQRIEKTITYLENQRQWIGSYEQWRKQGYPVGSGMIERAVAVVVNRRMKKRGMRWKRMNATAVVALRTDVLNEDWIAPQQLRAFPSSDPAFWSEPISSLLRTQPCDFRNHLHSRAFFKLPGDSFRLKSVSSSGSMPLQPLLLVFWSSLLVTFQYPRVDRCHRNSAFNA